MKDKKIIFVSALVAIFLLTVGLTYAYFSLTISGNDLAETINVDTTKLELKYTDGKEIRAENIEPGWTTTKTITVENTGNEGVYYSLGWQKLLNGIENYELEANINCISTIDSGECSGNFWRNFIPDTKVWNTSTYEEENATDERLLYPMYEQSYISSGEKQTITITITFVNYEDKAQNYNQGKTFYGTLGIITVNPRYDFNIEVTPGPMDIEDNDELMSNGRRVYFKPEGLEEGLDIPNAILYGLKTSITTEYAKYYTISFLNEKTGLNDGDPVKIEIKRGDNNVVKNGDIYTVYSNSTIITLEFIYDIEDGVKLNEPSLTEYLIKNYESLGLTKISRTEYRYQGASPNNYIKFNDEKDVWRIVGIEETVTPANYPGIDYQVDQRNDMIKIVREPIGNLTYNTVNSNTNYNDWTTSTLMTLLNSGPYYKRTKGTTAVDCSLGSSGEASCDYSNIGLQDSAKKVINAKTAWYLGNIERNENDYGNASEVYAQERGSNIHTNNKEIWYGSVGMLYPSDYMYASSSCYNDDTKKGNKETDITNSYSNEICKNSNWLYGKDYWTISPSADDTTTGVIVSSNGSILSALVNQVNSPVRPAAYLRYETAYVSGDGSKKNPFVISDFVINNPWEVK